MRRILLIIASVFVCFMIESILDEIVGRWFRPNLLIILVVFFNLVRGIRYSLFAAFVAGLLKDSFGTGVFGINIFSFIICAYLATIIKMYIYHYGSNASRMLLIFVIATINIHVCYVVTLMFVPIGFSDMFIHILLPEVFATTIVTTYAFKKLRQCVLGSFV